MTLNWEMVTHLTDLQQIWLIGSTMKQKKIKLIVVGEKKTELDLVTKFSVEMKIVQ